MPQTSGAASPEGWSAPKRMGGARPNKGRTLAAATSRGPSGSLEVLAGPSATLLASPAWEKRHQQLSLGCRDSRHLLVQNEVQVKSSVAGWTPILPASPLPGAEERKRCQRQPLEANAEGAPFRGGHDLQPGDRRRGLRVPRSATRRDPQARAIRGARGPALTPPRSFQTPRKQLSAAVQGFPSGFRLGSVSRFQVSRIPALYSAFSKGLLWAQAAGMLPRLRRDFAIEAVQS